MRVLTQDAILPCRHVSGLVRLVPSQDWVSIEGRAVLLQADPEGRPIVGCPNYGATIKPCTTTLPVEQGYSSWVRVDGRRLCLDAVVGLTDGTPPGTVKYDVRSPGQGFVGADA
ncbi:MAG TPA: hypothetical protein VEJ18_13850 [Planctomycetota bacterium]|nr:hypothetical protein [Planctomycetota bacterium]